MIIFQLGMAVTIFCALFYFFDTRPRKKQEPGRFITLLNRTSSFSLTFYFMHYMLIGWTLAVVWFISGHYLITELMGSIPALLCGIAGVVLLETFLYFWEKRRGKYSLEWFLGMITLALTGSEADKARARAPAKARDKPCGPPVAS